MPAWCEAVNQHSAAAIVSLARASWQGAAAIMLVLILVRVWSGMPRAAACWCWRLAYLKILLALISWPVISIPIAPIAHGEIAPTTASQWAGGALFPQRGPLVDSGATLAAMTPTPAAPSLSIPSLLAIGWALGVAIACVLLTMEISRASRLRRRTTPCSDPVILALYAKLVDSLGVRRQPELHVSRENDGPLLLGVARPIIVLPAQWPDQFTAEDLRIALCHELCHHARRDLVWNWLAAVVHSLLFFHPLVWLARREWTTSQEIACDDAVVRRLSVVPAAYARFLLAVVSATRSWRAVELPLATVSGTYQQLSRRIGAMNRFRTQTTTRTWIVAGALLLAGAMAAVPWRVVARDDAGTPSGKILVSYTDDNCKSFHLATVNLDGTQFQQIPTPKPMCMFPSVSPDGQRLCFLATDNNHGRGPTYIKLYISNVDGSGATRVGDSVIHATWTPDGKHLLATRWIVWMNDQHSKEDYRLQIVDLEGTTVRDLGQGGFGSYSPDGKTIAFAVVGDANDNGTLSLMDASGENRRVIDKSSSGASLLVSNYGCAWSPDGRSIAVARKSGGTDEPTTALAVVDIATREVRDLAQLMAEAADYSTVAWSPDGEWLAYPAPDGEALRIFMTRADGGAPRPITPLGKSCLMPVWLR